LFALKRIEFDFSFSSLILFAFMLIAVTCISCFTGLVLYATYYDCDPVKSQVRYLLYHIKVIILTEETRREPGFVSSVTSSPR